MKLITAIIRESKLDAVREALIEAEVSRITVSRVAGHGQQVKTEIYRGREVVPDLIPKARIEIALNDDFVDTTINTIVKAAQEGQVGDGKIFVTPLDDCVRIRTGEHGSSAI